MPRGDPRTRTARPHVPFVNKLVLNQWLLSLFNVKRFEELAQPLRDEALEGFDENNIHRLHHALTAHCINLAQLPAELLLEYDQNLDSNVAEISPAPLNKGERRFVEDLKSFHDGHSSFFQDRELYLLRNLSKGRGVGFFEAGNLHPDFIL